MEDVITKVRTEVARWIAQIFIYTLTAKSTATGAGDALEGVDGSRDPDAPANAKKSQRSGVRIQPFGFISVPPTKLRALGLRLGASNIFFIGIAPQKAYGPTDLEEGESAVYAKEGQTVLLNKDGDVAIDAKATRDVILNGGTKKVARVDDTAKADTLMATWMGQVEGFINGLTPGTVAPLASTFTNISIAKINSGADHIKG